MIVIITEADFGQRQYLSAISTMPIGTVGTTDVTVDDMLHEA